MEPTDYNCVCYLFAVWRQTYCKPNPLKLARFVLLFGDEQVSSSLWGRVQRDLPHCTITIGIKSLSHRDASVELDNKTKNNK